MNFARVLFIEVNIVSQVMLSNSKLFSFTSRYVQNKPGLEYDISIKHEKLDSFRFFCEPTNDAGLINLRHVVWRQKKNFESIFHYKLPMTWSEEFEKFFQWIYTTKGSSLHREINQRKVKKTETRNFKPIKSKLE